MANNGRMHLRIPQELKEFVHEYAADKNTTVSALVIRFFTQLRQEEADRDHPVDAEQV